MPGATRRIALITGANKGIGLETARQPGKTGIVVLLDARNLALGEKAAETIRLALLPDDGPTGGYFETAGANPWQAAYAEVGEEGTSVAEARLFCGAYDTDKSVRLNKTNFENVA
jgi:NAD(P)-dependent dehydrogenase (short-subunit alcohol dehydrogenase family)